MRQQLLALLLILAPLTGEALGDQIVLKNGDRLTGTIVKSDGKTIVFKSDLVGEVVSRLIASRMSRAIRLSTSRLPMAARLLVW